MGGFRPVLVAALAALAVGRADARSFSFDLRPPAPAAPAARGAPEAAPEEPEVPEDGVLRRTELPAGATDAPALEVGDELALAFFDGAEVGLVLRERTESPLGGETFLAGPAGGDLTAVVLQTENGLSVEALDADSGQSFSVVSAPDGVTVRERETPDAADERCLEVVEEDPVPDPGAGPSAAEQPEGCVDVLVAFDTAAAAWARESGAGTADFATMAVQKMNLALANSGLGTTFRYRLVGTLEVPAGGNGDLEAVLDWTRDGTGAWAAVKAERDRVGADVVTTLVDTGSSYGVTGIAFGLHGSDLAAFSGSAYNACAIRAVARAHTMTHECGHNLGAGHATAVNAERIAPGPQLYEYSAGHFFTGSDGVPYHTIMAYNWDGFGNNYDLAPLFSSPDLTWAGVRAGDAAHDNTKTIRRTWAAASAWRPTKVPTSWDVFFSPGDGTTFEGSIAVTLSPGKAGVEIRYTLDGTDPTLSSPRYEGPLVLTEPATVRAATVVDGALGPVFKAYYGPDPFAGALGTPRLRWETASDYPWIVQSDTVYDGATALRSGWIGDSAHGPSTLTAVMDCPTNTTMGFRYRKHFATGSFFAVFDEPADRSADEKCVFSDTRSGTSCEWTLAECEIPAGRRRVRFYFYQGGWHYVDENLRYEFNGVWLDDVKFDALSRPPAIRPVSSADETRAKTFAGELEITLVPPAGREGVLWYSTDGSDPSAGNGAVYAGPFAIGESTRVRAAFAESGLEPSVPVEARFLERHAIGPGEWTADAAGARAAAASDPAARLVAVMLSEGRTDGDCIAFASVARDPAFLGWCRTNGVYLVVSDGETQAESIAAGDWFWRLHDAWDPDDPVAFVPGFLFADPAAPDVPFAAGAAIADGASKIGSAVYDGTAESLVAGFASVLARPRVTVRFAANGGTGTMPAQTFRAGSAAATLRPNAFKRAGWAFAGWATSARGGVAYKDGQSVRNLFAQGGTVTLHAVWKPVSYRISFLSNGGKGTMPAQTASCGASVKLNANKFTRPGWVFLGWAKTAGGAVVWKNGQAVKNLSAAGGTAKLYAKWAKKNYKVVFHPNGGKGKAVAQTMTWGTAAKLRVNKFSRKKHVFRGWATKKGGPVVYKNGQSVRNLTSTGATVTLYAVWKKKK